jgi:hypothetical protein
MQRKDKVRLQQTVTGEFSAACIPRWDRVPHIQYWIRKFGRDIRSSATPAWVTFSAPRRPRNVSCGDRASSPEARRPFHVLHNQEMQSAGLVGVIGGDDVRVVQPGRRPHFLLEALGRGRVAQQAGVDDLQGAQAFHVPVLGQAGGR